MGVARSSLAPRVSRRSKTLVEDQAAAAFKASPDLRSIGAPGPFTDVQCIPRIGVRALVQQVADNVLVSVLYDIPS